jgi:phage-related protein
MQIIMNTVVPIYTTIANFIQQNSGLIVSILTAAWNLISSLISGVMTVIQGVVNTVLAAIQGDWDGVLNGLKTIAEGVFTALEGIWTSGMDLAKGVVNLGLEAIRTFFTTFVGDASGLGSDIINGIVDGVSNGVGALVEAVKAAAQQALEAAKDLLGIESPSKVFAAEIGKPSALGIAQGMLEGIPAISVAAERAAGMGVAGARAAVQRTMNITYAPTFGGGASSMAQDVGMLRTLAGGI